MSFARDRKGLRFDDHEFEKFFNGESVSETILRGIIAYCSEGMQDAESVTARNAWDRQFRGFSAEELLAHVSTDAKDDIDLMVAGPEELVPWIKDAEKRYRRTNPPLSTVEKPSDISFAARMINVSCGRSVCGKKGPRLSESEALETGLRHRGVTLEECVEKFTEWHDAQPECIRFCVMGKQRTATSICLSLTAEAYTGLKTGKLSDFDVDEKHLQLDTGLLMNEALGEAPHQGIDWVRPRSLSEKKMILRQIASLSRARQYHPYRVLGFDGSPEAAKRLRSNGFKETGFKMPRFGNTMYELSQDTSPVSYWLFYGFISVFRTFQ